MKEPIYVKNSQHRLKAHWRDYDYYISNVKKLTNDNKHLIPGIHKRGFHSYHIDHKISIKYGYENRSNINNWNFSFIPVNELLKNNTKIEYIFLTAWNFKSEIISYFKRNKKKFKFIVPLPVPKIF